MQHEDDVENEGDVVEVAIGLEETEVKAKRKIFMLLIFLNMYVRYHADIMFANYLFLLLRYHTIIYSALAVYSVVM